MALVTLPGDTQRKIYFYLYKKDILAVSGVCKQTHLLLTPLIDLFKKAQFLKEHGTLTDEEKGFRLEICGLRIRLTANLGAALGITQEVQNFRNEVFENKDKIKDQDLQELLGRTGPLTKKIHKHATTIAEKIKGHPDSVQFDKDGIPRLQERLKIDHPSFSQRFKIYRHFLYENKSPEIVASRFKAILEELKIRPLSPDAPLQDLLDRRKRVKKMNDELTHLTFISIAQSSEYTEFLSTLRLWERVVFKIAHIVFSIFEISHSLLFNRPQSWDKFESFVLSILPYQLNIKSLFNLRKFDFEEFKVSETQIILNSKNRDIRITTAFASDPLGMALFGFSKEYKLLGILQIQTVWQNTMGEYTEATPGPPGILTDRHLHIKFVKLSPKILKQDPATGDYPGLRLLIQFAMEIFKRAPEKKLTITANYSALKAILLSGGFDGMEEMKAEIQEARGQGKLFPDYPQEEYFGSDLTLNKTATPLATIFINNNNEPALADFTLSGSTTWEALIEKKPLIPGSGPVLPHHISRDLTPFEA